MTRVWALSLRTKLVLIIVLSAMIPLGSVGVRLSSNTRHTAESLLQSRLDSALSRATIELGSRWVAYRSTVSDLAEDTAVRRALVKRGARLVPMDAHLRGGVDRLRAATQAVLLLDTTGAPRWIVAADAGGMPVLVEAKDSLRIMTSSDPDRLSFRFPIASAQGAQLGFVESRFRVASLLTGSVGTSIDAGGLTAVVDRATGRVSAPIPLDTSSLGRNRFTWGGKEWLAATRRLTKWAVDVPAGSIGRLFDIYNTDQYAVDKGLYYTELHYEIGN